MDNRPLGGVLDGAAEYFVGEWGGISLTQEDKPHYVRNRVDVAPVEVDVGNAARGPLQVNEQSGKGICDHGTPGMEDTIAAIAPPMDTKMLGEVGSVSALDLEKVDSVVGR
jgi:hypothetical protein